MAHCISAIKPSSMHDICERVCLYMKESVIDVVFMLKGFFSTHTQSFILYLRRWACLSLPTLKNKWSPLTICSVCSNGDIHIPLPLLCNILKTAALLTWMGAECVISQQAWQSVSKVCLWRMNVSKFRWQHHIRHVLWVVLSCSMGCDDIRSV